MHYDNLDIKKRRYQTRYTILLFAMLANLLSYCLRTELNLTIVSMVKHEENVDVDGINVCLNDHSLPNATNVSIAR